MNKKYLLSALLATLFCSIVHADVEVYDQEDAHVSLQVNEGDEKKAALLQEERSKRAKEFDELYGVEAQAEAAKTPPAQDASSSMTSLITYKALAAKSPSSQASLLTNIYYKETTLPIIRLAKNKAYLNDGSVWKINPKDQYQTYSWLSEESTFFYANIFDVDADKVAVRCNPNWPAYSPFRYHLTNQRTAGGILANLEGVYVDENTRYIVSRTWLYDVYGNLFVQFKLNDGSVWNTLPVDTQCLNWHEGDVVIVGVNTDQYSAFAPYMLINAVRNNNGAAACVLCYN